MCAVHLVTMPCPAPRAFICLVGMPAVRKGQGGTEGREGVAGCIAWLFVQFSDLLPSALSFHFQPLFHYILYFASGITGLSQWLLVLLLVLVLLSVTAQLNFPWALGQQDA